MNMPFSLNMPFFVKLLMEWCFGCHGNTNRDNSFVYFNLMLKIRC